MFFVNKNQIFKYFTVSLLKVLTEYCVLPLLTDRLHQATPHIKSILLAGPKGSGKDMLVHAVCNEIGKKTSNYI